MLAIVVLAATGTLLLAFVVQLCLWTLRMRRPKSQLSAWTAALIASVAMLAISPVVVPSSFGAPVAHAWAPHEAYARLTAAYVLVATLLLLRLMWGLILSWKMLRATQLVGADWAKGNKLRTNTWIGAPVTVGSHMLLPAECVNWDARKRRAVLAHETAHAARGDFYVQLLSRLHCAVFWFSPLSWWLHGRLTALAEMASDEAAIAALGDRPAYAAILRDMAGLPGCQFLGVEMARPATIGPRVARTMAKAHSNSKSKHDEQKENSHEDNGRHLVTRDIRHRPVVRFHARVGHQNERQMLHVV